MRVERSQDQGYNHSTTIYYTITIRTKLKKTSCAVSKVIPLRQFTPITVCNQKAEGFRCSYIPACFLLIPEIFDKSEAECFIIVMESRTTVGWALQVAALTQTLLFSCQSQSCCAQLSASCGDRNTSIKR